MGVGIWSMHFVGMLAFHLPVPIGYQFGRVVLSVLVAVAASALALVVVSRPKVGVPALAVGALCMGPAIAGMHYIGMAALNVPAALHWDYRPGGGVGGDRHRAPRSSASALAYHLRLGRERRRAGAPDRRAPR